MLMSCLLQSLQACFATLADTSRLQLALSIISCKLWCQARTLHFPVLGAGQMSISKLIHYFLVIQLLFDSRLLHQPIIPLNPANERADQRLSGWHWWNCLCHFRHRAVYFWHQNCFGWYCFCYRVLIVEWLQLWKCMIYLLTFMTFLTMQCGNRLVIQLVF